MTAFLKVTSSLGNRCENALRLMSYNLTNEKPAFAQVIAKPDNKPLPGLILTRAFTH